MDTLGINYLNNNIDASVILSNKNYFGIQFYNKSNEEVTLYLEIDLYELNINGKVKSITNLFDNSNVLFNNNKLTLKIGANSPLALKVLYE